VALARPSDLGIADCDCRGVADGVANDSVELEELDCPTSLDAKSWSLEHW